MPFPTTRREMKTAGYEYLHAKICPCGAKIEMWQTPLGKTTPMNVMQDDDAQAVSHFATCPRVTDFRKKK
jgi:hypothetical protein